jgi:shikimate kinase
MSAIFGCACVAFFIIQATIMQPQQSTPRIVERIVLVGFMGAGKSTLGPILAERLGWRFLDSDQQLESETRATIADLFTTLGEPAFRRMEAQVVELLLRQPDVVIALGGGAVESESTRSMIATSSDTCVIFLQASLDILIDRCERQPNAAVRPVLRQRETLRQRFCSRLPYYESAHITVETEGLTPHSVVDRLLRAMLEASYAVPLQQKAITT